MSRVCEWLNSHPPTHLLQGWHSAGHQTLSRLRPPPTLGITHRRLLVRFFYSCFSHEK
jgi:hypothetical protein